MNDPGSQQNLEQDRTAYNHLSSSKDESYFMFFKITFPYSPLTPSLGAHRAQGHPHNVKESRFSESVQAWASEPRCHELWGPD